MICIEITGSNQSFYIKSTISYCFVGQENKSLLESTCSLYTGIRVGKMFYHKIYQNKQHLVYYRKNLFLYNVSILFVGLFRTLHKFKCCSKGFKQIEVYLEHKCIGQNIISNDQILRQNISFFSNMSVKFIC